MEHEFDVTLDDGRVAHCWVAQSQPYLNAILTAGLVTGIPPDNYFLRFSRDGQEPTTLFLREDEALAVLFTLAGALWSQEILDMDSKDER